MVLIVTIVRRIFILLVVAFAIFGFFTGHAGMGTFRFAMASIPYVENITAIAVTIIEVLL